MLKEEIVEVEFDEDDILYYIDDQFGNEIGFAVMEDGKEVEYYYPDEPVNEDIAEAVDTVLGAAHKVVDDNPFVTRQEVSDLGRNLNAIAKENQETIKAMRDIGRDIKEFASFFKDPFKPREEKPVEEKPAEVEARVEEVPPVEEPAPAEEAPQAQNPSAQAE